MLATTSSRELSEWLALDLMLAAPSSPPTRAARPWRAPTPAAIPAPARPLPTQEELRRKIERLFPVTEAPRG